MENHFQPVYHLVPAGYYRAQAPSRPYKPPAFDQEGFIHCTAGVDLLIEIANTYFKALPEDLLVLEVDPRRLTAPLKYEPPIPPPGQNSTNDTASHAGTNLLFPHIYGLLNRKAIIDTFALQRDEVGRWQMPAQKIAER